MTGGLLIAAPASGSGKTVITLALLRHLSRAERAVASIKTGPDYIDPAFHAVASGRPCLNLDSWAMRRETLAHLVARVAEGAELIIGEGVMGLYDGAPDGGGSTAELAELTGWPVVLVVDAAGMAASAAALLHGFASYRPAIQLAAVIFNRVGGEGHGHLLREACAPLDIPILGAVPRLDGLALPDRHLGLVQAGEHPDLEAFLDAAAELVARHVDTEALSRVAQPARLMVADPGPAIPPLGQHIAVARDTAFAFAYPSVLDGWRQAGAAISCFSPLGDEGPDPAADAVYLPGGYPELHAGRLAASGRFLDGLCAAAAGGKTIYGECGGYMVLGHGLVDGDGLRHEMAGLLPLETSFAAPRLTLGYRAASLAAKGPLGPAGARYRGHEFHFARVLREPTEAPLFHVRDSKGRSVGGAGLRAGTVMGSFLHLVDQTGSKGQFVKD